MVMAVARPGGPGLDLYQLLGVPREASRQEIAQAWRCQARAEHPDSRPGDDASAGRFRALATAWHVLGDPARRAAYDQALSRGNSGPPTAAPAARPRPAGRAPMMRPARPSLWAGPVQVEGPHRAPAGAWEDTDEEMRLAILAELGLRYLSHDWEWPW